MGEATGQACSDLLDLAGRNAHSTLGERQRIARPGAFSVYATLLAALCVIAFSADVRAQSSTGIAATGASLFVSKGCSGCHAASSSTKANAINAGSHITHVNSLGNLNNGSQMGGQADSGGTQYNDIAAYFATLFADMTTQTVGFGAPSTFPIYNFVLNTQLGDYVGLRKVGGPSKGDVTFNGLVATYTPLAGQCGSDSFTYEAYRAVNSGTSNLRTLNLTIQNPAIPDISTSNGSILATNDAPISIYTPVSTGGPPLSYAITSGALPPLLELNPSTGVISGKPTQAGTVTATLTARNCFNGNPTGQSASKAITITVTTSTTLQAPLSVTATPNPAGSGTVSTLSTTGGSGVGTVSYTSNSGSCGISGNALTANASSGSCTITATKAGDGTYLGATATVLVNLLLGQTITFGALTTKQINEPAFTVTATGGPSNNPVIVTASGVCTAGGTNGSTITLTGTPGTCAVTANQSGNATYAAAPAVTQSFDVVALTGDEPFPPNCQVPAGWTTAAGAATGWSVAYDWKSSGVCSLKSNPLPNTGSPLIAGIQYTADFAAGNIRFDFRTSSESNRDCLKFYIDGVVQFFYGYYGTCSSGDSSSYTPISIPITAGTHTIAWQYEKDGNGLASGLDAAWIDNVLMPVKLAPVITGPATVNGVIGDLTYQIAATNYPTSYAVESCPPGLQFCNIYSFEPNVLNTRTYVPGTYVVVVSASNAYGKGTKSVTFNVDKGILPIDFPEVNNRLVTVPPFTVSATSQYEYRGIPVTFSASGVCTSTGTNGALITLTGVPGTCAITASTIGDESYYPAVPVTRNVLVSAASSEIFPPNCAMPAGWTVPAGADAGWSVMANESSTEGACSLKSNDLPNLGYRQYARIQFTGTFQAGQVSFKHRVFMETDRVCLNFYIDGVGYRVWDSPACYGIGAATGDLAYQLRYIPITAGTHTLMWEVAKDEWASNTGGEDRAWLDEVVLPLQTLTVSKTGSGTITSLPYGIDCGATCSKAMSGTIILSATPNADSYFVGWSGGGCSGTGTCRLTLTGAATVTATFSLILVPGAPTITSAAPGTVSASLAFNPPASNGGGAITQYAANCVSGPVTRTGSATSSPVVVTGLSSGVQYSCVVAATNSAGTGPPSPAITVQTLTPPTNDNFANRITVNPMTLVGTGNNFGTTLETGEPSHGTGGAHSVWWSWTAPTTGAWRLTTTGSNFDTLLAVYTGSALNALTLVAQNDDYAASIQSGVTFYAVAGTTYSFAIDGKNGQTGSISFTFTSPGNDNFIDRLNLPGSAVTVLGNNTTATTEPGEPLHVAISNSRSLWWTWTAPATDVVTIDTCGSSFDTLLAVYTGAVLNSLVSIGANDDDSTCASDSFNSRIQFSATAGAKYQIAVDGYGGATGDITLHIVQRQAQSISFSGPASQPYSAISIVLVATATSSLPVTFSSLTPSICSVSDTSLAMLAAGVCTIAADQAGDAAFYPAARVQQSFTISPLSQSISFTAQPAQVFASGATFMLSPAATATSGLTIAYTSSSPATCSVSGGNVTMLAVGNCSITASQPGNAVYSAATPVTQVIAINIGTQSITFPAQLAQGYVQGGSFMLSPLATASSGLAVSYASTTPSVCTASGSTISMLSAGACSITASQSGNTNYIAAAPVSQVITINPGTQTISFPSQLAQPYSPGGAFMIAPPAAATSGLPVTYGTNTPAICSVSGGVVTIIATGICAVTANQSGNSNFNPALQVTQNIAINPSTPAAPVIGTATGGNNQAAVAFTPSPNTGGTAIANFTATCTANGQITRSASGTSSPITVTQLTNDIAYSCSVTATNAATLTSVASAPVNVTPTATPVPPTITSVSAATFTVFVAGTFTVTATGTPVPTLSLAGALPTGVTFTPPSGALAGTPATNQAGSYPVTLTATNASGTVMQSFTLTVQKASQSITFSNPGAQTFTATPQLLTATASSLLPVSFASQTTSTCTVSGGSFTMIAPGSCTITAGQPGNADYSAAAPVTQTFLIGAATQTIAFAAQTTATRSYAAGSSFAINPLATASSGLPVSYSSTTPAVCTVSGTNVSMIAAGTCTIAANQTGNATISAAASVSQSVVINAIAPGAPVITNAAPGNAQTVITFNPPADTGGSPIVLYTAVCGAFNVTGATSPITVGSLTNNTTYSCTVKATTAAALTGAASTPVQVTPLSGNGAGIWAANCATAGCHGAGALPQPPRFNAAGSTTTVIDYVFANQSPMKLLPSVTGLTPTQRQELAAYLLSQSPGVNVTTPFNTAANVDVFPNIVLNSPTATFQAVEVVTAPTSGTLSGGGFTGTTITYTPNNGFTGTDSFTYRGKNTSGAPFVGDAREVFITVQPPDPVITSALTASGTVGQPFAYQVTATNLPTLYAATGLPGTLAFNTSTGVISGTPTSVAILNITVGATNATSSDSKQLVITISPAGQFITFTAQVALTRAFSAGGTFPINPTASGGTSGNPIVYGSATTGVCTVSGTTVTIVAAGICTLTADQAGNANYAAAPTATQGVTITPVEPGVPTGIGATAGNASAIISFTPPASNGGSPITFYTVTCNNGAVPVNGAGSPITVSQLTIGLQYSCSVTATSAGGTSAPSVSANVTPIAISFDGTVVSRKFHPGTVQGLDIPINPNTAITGAVDVEPRTIGAGHQIIFGFTGTPSSVTSLAVTDAANQPIGSASYAFNTNQLIVTLTGIPDNRRVKVTATGVNGTINVSASMGFLVGDINNSRRVTASDIAAIKARALQPFDPANFKADVNARGTISASDVSAVKARAGVVLP